MRTKPTKKGRREWSKEERALYKRNWDRRKREEYAGKRAEDSYMHFFYVIIKSMNLNFKTLSKLTGYSQQRISWWMTSDDCSLSNIKTVFSRLGLEIACRYEAMNTVETVITEERYSITMNNLPFVIGRKPSYHGTILDEVNGNIRFLADFIKKQNLTLPSFCEIIDLNYHAVYSWFKKDDLKISAIYKVAKIMNQRVVWEVARTS